ncbi:MAG: site-2 protease family protein [Armatimonadetes bacterium]|nr:site-2 protease family protein [Armatimonadota bacterium]
MEERILTLVCALPALVAGLTVHEFAHAWAADRLGDDTPRREGRLTLDPMAHLDLFGSLFFVLAWFSGYGLGWAKPVMTNHRNFAHPRRDSALVAVAGPISNILQVPFWLAAVFAFGFAAQKFGIQTGGGVSPVDLVGFVLTSGIMLNIGLAAFNMIPIPPLDGHWILQSLGGRPIEELFDMIRPFSFLLLILLINFTPLFDVALFPIQSLARELAYNVAQAGQVLALR